MFLPRVTESLHQPIAYPTQHIEDRAGLHWERFCSMSKITRDRKAQRIPVVLIKRLIYYFPEALSRRYNVDVVEPIRVPLLVFVPVFLVAIVVFRVAGVMVPDRYP